MNEKQREFMEVQSGLQSPFWKWLRKYLDENAKDTLDSVVELIPASVEQTNEREQNIGKYKALKQLVDQIPTTISDKMKELEHED